MSEQKGQPAPALNPEDWTYRAEGAASVVFGYTGTEAAVRGKVLRVRKVSKTSKRNGEDKPGTVTDDDIWKDIPALASEVPFAERAAAYVAAELQPCLGPFLADCGVVVPVTADFLSALQSTGAQARPPGAPGTPALDLTVTRAQLLFDHCVFRTPSPIHSGCSEATPEQQSHAATPSSGGHAPTGCTWTFEIKPKCGFVPECLPFVECDARRAVKTNTTRFAMHQHLKHGAGAVHRRSAYCPVDLFSEDPVRMHSALRALLLCPQNNLRLLQDARLLHPLPTNVPSAAPTGDEQGGDGAGNGSTALDAVQSAMGELVGGAGRADAVGAAVNLLCAVLLQERCLARILHLQRRDVYDVEFIHHLVHAPTPPPPAAPHPAAAPTGPSGHRLALPPAAPALPGLARGGGGLCSAAEDEAGCSHSRQLEFVRAGGADARMAALRDFLVATTAKDCAIMISLRRLHPSRADSLACTHLDMDPATCSHSAAGTARAQSSTAEECTLEGAAVGQVWDQASGQCFQYKVAIVDLDIKSISKLPKWFELDREIVGNYMQVGETAV